MKRRARSSRALLLSALAFTSMVFIWVAPAWAPPTGPCVVQPSGLVSWWGFEGNANDFRGVNNGTTIGSPSQFVPGEDGLGFQSGGGASLVVVPDAPSLFAPQFTIDVWVKATALTTSNMPIVWRGNATLLDDSSGYSLEVIGSPGSLSFTPGAVLTGTPSPGKILFMINNGTLDQAIVSSFPIPFGLTAPFTHIAASMDGANLSLSVNGVLDTVATRVISPLHHASQFQIGSAVSSPNPSFYFSGVIDELDYFSRALTSTEVQSIFNAGSSGKCGGGLPPFVGRVCIAPGDTLACPQTLPPIIADPTGHATVSVNILGSTLFNAFSILLRWDPSVMNGTTISAPGTVPLSPTVTASCINHAGFGCGSLDALGIAHVDVAGSSSSAAPISGQLFKVSFIGSPGVNLPIGFANGCSPTAFSLQGFGMGTVPNTDTCVLVGISNGSGGAIAPVSEGLQSQSLGTFLPTALASVSPPGKITNIHSGGNHPNFADTWILPYPITMAGNITGWKAEFDGGYLNSTLPFPSVPVGVQVKVLRRTLPNATNLLTVIEAGPVHEPGHVLKLRLPSYPFVTEQSTVIPYYTDSLLTVLPGDFVGFTIMANATLGAWYNYPFVNSTGATRFVLRNVGLGGTVDLSDLTTLTFSGLAPAIEVDIQPSPPRPDTADDGIPDFVVLSPEGQALGMDPCRKTVAVQLDYMIPPPGAGYTHLPQQAALDIVTQAFDAAPVPVVSNCPYTGYPRKPSGVNLIVDVKNAIPQQDVLNFTHSEPWSFDSLKAAYMDPNRVDYFHYGIFAHNVMAGRTTSGAAEIFGSNFIVSLGGWTNNEGSIKEQAGTFMHELGHNLGLDHGGSDDINFKPNYESVMSYEHQVVGIITQTPTGNVTRFDYSREAMPSLNEAGLTSWIRLSNTNDYTKWVCPDHHLTKIELVSNFLDWNCNGILQAGISSDLNNDTRIEIMAGHNDWASLQYKFVQSANFNIGCFANCDIGCFVNCDIGCFANCDIGTHLDFPTAQAIEASWAAFLATPHHSTATSVNCVPTLVLVNTPTVCQATVSDTSPGASAAPTGTVSFLSSQPGTFAPPTCPLTPSGVTATCSVSFTPVTSSLGPQAITAGYSGDANHLGSNGVATVNGLTIPTVSKFYTDANLNPLPTDNSGNPKVDVILANGIVKSTNPGEIIAWVKVTDTIGSPVQSFTLDETLPVDWIVAPVWLPGKGAIHIFYANTTSLGTNPDITQPKSISLDTGNPEVVHLALADIGATAIGHPLFPGQSILLGVKLDYGLSMTGQPASSYPRNYTDTASTVLWTQTSYTGTSSSASGSAFFIAYAKILGDVNGDGRVNIFDLALVGKAFGSNVGDPNYNAAEDLNGDGKINIFDLAIVGSNFGG